MKKKHFKWLLVLAWMIVIFLMSNDPGDVSSEKSRFVMYIFSLLGIDLNSVFGEWASFAVRKTAHMSEYFILCLLFFNALHENIKTNRAIILSLIFSILYAISDEFHQIFVPGRAGRAFDVLIDTTGANISGVIIYFSSKLKTNKRKDKF